MSVVNICAVTATRAEYGLLYPVLKALQESDRYNLSLVVTGTHLSPEFGSTISEIEQDGIPIAATVDILAQGDDEAAIARTIGNAAGGFGEYFAANPADLLLVLGDRYELLPIVLVAHVCRIPVAHIAGGDITEGAIDDAIRHSVTKLSRLHFVTNEESGRRVRQMGESPESIFVVGETGVDNIRTTEFLSREALSTDLDFEWRASNLLVTFHPVTLGNMPSLRQLEELLQALESLGNDFGVVITFPNADADGRAMLRRIEEFAAEHDNMVAFSSLGRLRYLSVMHHVDAVVGNSSSGIMEAPAMNIPTVNIGDRQKGRPQASSIVQCEVDSAAISAAIQTALQLDCSEVETAYGDGHSADQIMAVLDDIDDFAALGRKRFAELDQ